MRIIIIEDDHKIAQSIKRGLEQEGYSVDVAFTGTEGYDLVVGEEYDLLILDLMLPGMDGAEICTRLRNINNNIPILMLTAKGNIQDKVKGLNSGADDYLPKPFAFEELLARIRALLRRPKELVQNILECGDLVMNLITFKVTRASKEISLTKKEFALLEYLIRNKNNTVSKSQILSHVWSYESDVLPNTVEQYIRYLRSKIDEPFKDKKQLISTIRGFGYRISE